MTSIAQAAYRLMQVETLFALISVNGGYSGEV
jgi:hypothetical protein